MLAQNKSGMSIVGGRFGGLRERVDLASLTFILSQEIIPHNTAGFTFDPRRREFPRFENGVFVVALKGYERSYFELPNSFQVLAWISDCIHVLREPGTYVGGWLDEGIFYLDVSVPIYGRNEAVTFGLANVQTSIFDVAMNKEVVLGSLETGSVIERSDLGEMA